MLPAEYDFSIVRGTQGAGQGLQFRLKARDDADALQNLPYEDVRLSIYNKSGTTLIQRFTLSGNTLVEIDPSEAELAWNPTSAQTRLIPKGVKASYELEVWNGGSEVVYMYGLITGIGGLNDDEDVS